MESLIIYLYHLEIEYMITKMFDKSFTNYRTKITK